MHYNRIHDLINYAKLNKHQCGIIIRLITEHIEPNQYIFRLKLKYHKTNQFPSLPDCSFCDNIKSVNHFILKCKMYNNQRDIMLKKRKSINYRYISSKFRTIKGLFFPYLLFHSSIKKQCSVWKEILNYIKVTKFENIYQIDKNQIWTTKTHSNTIWVHAQKKGLVLP